MITNDIIQKNIKSFEDDYEIHYWTDRRFPTEFVFYMISLGLINIYRRKIEFMIELKNKHCVNICFSGNYFLI